MKPKIDRIPDLFDSSLIHICFDSEEAGTVRELPGAWQVSTPAGQVVTVPDYPAAIKFLESGRLPKPLKIPDPVNQLSLF